MLYDQEKAKSTTKRDTTMTAFVTGADHGLGFALTQALLDRGWDVVATRYKEDWQQLPELAAAHGNRLLVVPIDIADTKSVSDAARITAEHHESIDLVINCAGVLGNDPLETRIGQGLDYASVQNTINVNALGAIRVTEALLPLVRASTLKRLCFVSSEAGSITKSYRTGWYGYSMSKTALNMGVSILFNDLRRDGFTFRVYHPGWMQTWMTGSFSERATYTANEAAVNALRVFLETEVDEDRFVLRDEKGTEWPW